MNLSKIYLDANLKEHLKTLLVGEAESKTKNLKFDFVRNSFKTRILQLLVIYEQVDSIGLDFINGPYLRSRIEDDFDWNFMLKNGLLSTDSTMIKQPDLSKIFESKSFTSELEKEVDETVISLLESSKERIINLYLHKHKIVRPSLTTKPYLNSVFDKLLAGLKNDIAMGDLIDFPDYAEEFGLHSKDSYFSEFLQHIEFDLKLNLTYSYTTGLAFTPSLFKVKDFQLLKSSNSLDEVICVAKTNFDQETRVLPYPQNLSDVLRYRERKEIKRYREVLSYWLNETVEPGFNLESKMRMDIAKASKELKKVTKWKEYRNSQLNFLVNGIGGHIPIVSNVLTIVNSVGYLYEKHSKRKHGWIHLFS